MVTAGVHEQALFTVLLHHCHVWLSYAVGSLVPRLSTKRKPGMLSHMKDVGYTQLHWVGASSALMGGAYAAFSLRPWVSYKDGTKNAGEPKDYASQIQARCSGAIP